MPTDYEAIRAQIKTILADAGITFSAQHVPTKYDPRIKPGDSAEWGKVNCIAWTVEFKSKRGKFETNYSAGIGHLPKSVYPLRDKYIERKMVESALQSGKIPRSMGSDYVSPGKTPLPPPDAADVLGCLISDASAADYGSFEEWASDTGYEADSRKAEKIFNACKETALNLYRVIGAETLDKLRPLTQEL